MSTASPATLHLEELWIRNVTITTGLVDTYSTPTLIKLVASAQLDVDRFITHHFRLDEFMDAYDTFAAPATPAPSRSSSPATAPDAPGDRLGMPPL